eukprot:4560253-Prymnesium_polylepis.1
MDCPPVQNQSFDCTGTLLAMELVCKKQIASLKHELRIAQAHVHAHDVALRKITAVERQDAERRLE